MTDNEIINVWSLCQLEDSQVCETCPLGQNYPYCDEILQKETLDLINRQKAEIERLQKAIKVQDIMIDQHDYYLKKAKAEARKEFAERLNKEAENAGIDRDCFIYSDSDNTAFEIYDTVAEWCKEVTNNFLKEKAGADDERTN